MNDILTGLALIGITGALTTILFFPKYQLPGWQVMIGSLVVAAVAKWQEGDTATCVKLLIAVAIAVVAYIRDCRRAVK